MNGIYENSFCFQPAITSVCLSLIISNLISRLNYINSRLVNSPVSKNTWINDLLLGTFWNSSMQVVVVVVGLGGNNHLLCFILSEPMLVFVLFIYFLVALLKEAPSHLAQHEEGAACSWWMCGGHQIKRNWILRNPSKRQYETKAINLAEGFLLTGGRIERSGVKPSLASLLLPWLRTTKTMNKQ